MPGPGAARPCCRSARRPPLLLVHGWPQTWYQYRLVMPAPAGDFEVIAVDQRGIGLTDKPPDGYDIGTLAADLVALRDALGHQRFAMAGFDTGMFIGYAPGCGSPGPAGRRGGLRPGRVPHRPCSSLGRSTSGSGTSPSTGLPW